MAAVLPNPGARAGTFSVLIVISVAAVLYLAREVLIPLAILLAFLLAPAVSLLERWRLGRVPATALVVILAFSIIGAVGSLAWD
jgi:predicted PurR-regulated permease PerM